MRNKMCSQASNHYFPTRLIFINEVWSVISLCKSRITEQVLFEIKCLYIAPFLASHISHPHFGLMFNEKGAKIAIN